MSKVFVDVGVSLDGYMAGPNRGPGNPLGDGGPTIHAARGKDVRVSGGVDTIRQYLRAGLIDDITLHIAPVLLDDGQRLFDASGPADVQLEQQSVSSSALVTHINYRVVGWVSAGLSLRPWLQGALVAVR